jgi:adenylate kinase
LLRDRLGVACIGTGDILREASAQGTPLGLQVRPLLQSGQLVSDELVNGLVAERLRRPDRPQCFILDGFPRTLAQAEALDAVLSELKLTLTAAVLFRIHDNVVVTRMLGRGRGDDTEQTIRQRLEIFHRTTRPLLDFYRRKGLLREVDADDAIERVYVRVAASLMEL